MDARILSSFDCVTNNSTVSVIGGGLIIVLIALLIDYQLLTFYWASKKVPGPRAIPFIGVVYKFLHSSNPQVYADWIKQYGRVFGTVEARNKCLVISDADLIKDVLIKNFHKFSERRSPTGHWVAEKQLINQGGIEWKTNRALLSPAFTSSKMKLMYPLMQECYTLLDRELKNVACKGEEVTVKDLFNRLTTTVIAACAFATKVDAFRNDHHPLIKNLRAWMTPRPFLNFVAVMLPKSVKRAIQFSAVEASSREYVIRTCEEIQQQRKSMKGQTGNHNDLLQLLLDASSDQDKSVTGHSDAQVVDNESHYVLNDEKKTWEGVEKSKKRLTQQEIIANTVLFFLAGYETTSSLLTHATFLLATHPHIQEQLFREIEQNLPSKDPTKLEYEQLTSIKYLDAFISEVLRLYPATTRLERLACENHTFSNGLTVEKGTIIQIPIYNVHRDEEYFEDAEKFNPDRFLPENRGKIIPGSYLPFVIGPKNCIGMRFALMEAKIALVNIVSKYQIVACDKTSRVKAQFKPGLLLQLAEEVVVKILPRQSSVKQ